jgi:hypothetical protein
MKLTLTQFVTLDGVLGADSRSVERASGEAGWITRGQRHGGCAAAR